MVWPFFVSVVLKISSCSPTGRKKQLHVSIPMAKSARNGVFKWIHCVSVFPNRIGAWNVRIAHVLKSSTGVCGGD